MPIEIIMTFCVIVLGCLLAVVVLLPLIKSKMTEIKARPEKPAMTPQKRAKLAGQCAIIAACSLALALGLDAALEREGLDIVQILLIAATKYVLLALSLLGALLAFGHVLVRKWRSEEITIEKAVEEEREACLKIIESIAQENGKPACCGNGLYGSGGGPPECCNDPKIMIDSGEAIQRILSRGDKADA